MFDAKSLQGNLVTSIHHDFCSSLSFFFSLYVFMYTISRANNIAVVPSYNMKVTRGENVESILSRKETSLLNIF